MEIPRPEYPRPQMVRDQYKNLNGQWQFEIDFGESGRERRLFAEGALKEEITVPFCPESRLSGIGYTDFMACVWYKKTVSIPDAWRKGGRVLLHIGACDYHTEVWINAQSVGCHFGGYCSFSFDITDSLRAGDNLIAVCATDHTRSGVQPTGKQSHPYASEGCFYTRTTGIWQTVWMEYVPYSYIQSLKYTPDIHSGVLHLEAVCKNAHGLVLKAEAAFQGKPAGSAETVVSGNRAVLTIALKELHLWGCGTPNLYDLHLMLGEDRVESYFGMREIVCHDGKFLLNGEPIFQRLVLDQGFYPDGIYTAPSDAALKGDIERSFAMGFNGARLHQKVFEPRFLFHCDRMGYLVWGEHANWGLDLSRPEAWQGFLPEWLEIVSRDYNHPSIVGWCPLNETQKDQNPELVRMIDRLTHALDPTRPIIDTSGWVHVEGISDVVDIHDYEQDPAVFKERYDALTADPNGKPVFLSEYGGTWWSEETDVGWGYGVNPLTKEGLTERIRGLTEALLFNPRIAAFCYTQLTDVEQEVNGLYTYDRKPKVDPAVVSSILRQKAAIEKEEV